MVAHWETVGNYVTVKCVQNSDSFDLTHYLIFEDGSSLIYMGTYTVSEPSVGELRFIARLTALPEAYPFRDVSSTSGGTAIEGSDVFTVDGQTRSKVSPVMGKALWFLKADFSYGMGMPYKWLLCSL